MCLVLLIGMEWKASWAHKIGQKCQRGLGPCVECLCVTCPWFVPIGSHNVYQFWHGFKQIQNQNRTTLFTGDMSEVNLPTLSSAPSAVEIRGSGSVFQWIPRLMSGGKSYAYKYQGVLGMGPKNIHSCCTFSEFRDIWYLLKRQKLPEVYCVAW